MFWRGLLGSISRIFKKKQSEPDMEEISEIKPSQSAYELVDQMRKKGLYLEAFEELNKMDWQSLSESEKYKLKLLKGKILVRRWRDFVKSSEIINQVIIDLEWAAGFETIKFDAQLELAWILMLEGNYEDVLSALDGSTQLLGAIPKEQKTEIRLREGQLLELKGSLYWSKGEYDIAIKFERQALVVYNSIGFDEGTAESNYLIGHTLRSLSDFKKAIKHFEQSLAINEQFGNKYRIVGSLMGIGLVYIDVGDIDSASMAFERALIISQDIGYFEYLALGLQLMGSIYAKKGDVNRGTAYKRRSHIIYEKIGSELKSHLPLFY
ncbi:MAG: tetratricopeptide repeat protein [Candidatus Thorarchaeota archaeon]